jgi:hypothetical protein
MTPSEPGRMGTLAFFMVWRAVDFSPIRRVTSGWGPMNLMLEARQTSAKLAFSLSRP